MNFLAHFYFSYPHSGLMVGNFIADNIKGKKYLDYPKTIQEGILHHRFLDEQTDTSIWIKNNTALLRPTQKKYAPVVVDVLFDYYLSNHWDSISEVPLKNFIDNVFTELDHHEKSFPLFMQMMYKKMKQLGWLSMYKTIDGLSTILFQMGERVNFDNNMKDAHLVLLEHHKEFEYNFTQFFIEINQKNKEYLS